MIRSASPEVNIQNLYRVVDAQRKRLESATAPVGLKDRVLTFIARGLRRVSGRVGYTDGLYAQIEATTQSGSATLHQLWDFDPQGLKYVTTVKRLNSGEVAADVSLQRGEDGKFQVLKSERTEHLPEWDRQFRLAQKRMALRRNRD